MERGLFSNVVVPAELYRNVRALTNILVLFYVAPGLTPEDDEDYVCWTLCCEIGHAFLCQDMPHNQFRLLLMEHAKSGTVRKILEPNFRKTQ